MKAVRRKPTYTAKDGANAYGVMIYFDERSLQKLDEICEKEERSRSWVIRQAIRNLR